MTRAPAPSTLDPQISRVSRRAFSSPREVIGETQLLFPFSPHVSARQQQSAQYAEIINIKGKSYRLKDRAQAKATVDKKSKE